MRPTHIFSGIGSRHTLFFLSFFFVAVFTPMTAPLTQQTKVSHPQPPHTEPSQLNMTAKSCLKFSLITSSSQFISSGGKEPAKKREKIRKNQIYFFSFLEKRDIFFLFFKKKIYFSSFFQNKATFFFSFLEKKRYIFCLLRRKSDHANIRTPHFKKWRDLQQLKSTYFFDVPDIAYPERRRNMLFKELERARNVPRNVVFLRRSGKSAFLEKKEIYFFLFFF